MARKVEGLPVALYLALILALSAGIHAWLEPGAAGLGPAAAAGPVAVAGPMPAVGPMAVAEPVAQTEAPVPNRAVEIGANGAEPATSRSVSVAERPQSAATTDSRPLGPLAPEELVHDRRGLWLTDWARGRVARVDAAPVPRQTALVPILMYHHVRPIDFGQSSAFAASLTLPPSQFDQQLRYLKEKGFRTATLEELVLYFEGRKDLPARSVVLTFDDGYLDNYLYAYPLLARYGFNGTFFIITGMVGQGDYATWTQLGEMVAGGMEIGSHTISHPDLPHLPAAQRDRELVESKRVLQENLGVAIRALSYPSGSHSRDAATAARNAGYTIAVTTQYGATHDRAKLLELSRVRIQGTDTLPIFRWRIEQYFPTTGPAAS